MQTFTHKTLSLLLVLSCIPLLGLECHWSGRDDADGSSSSASASDPVENLDTQADATVTTIDVTTMEVETDDGVILTCDLPTGVVLVVGDRVEITIFFESNESQWVIVDVEFFQRL